MSTQAQISANRRNAAKSTGPSSVAGKAASRLNALKSGIFADSTVIIGEDENALNELVASFYRDLQPETAMEAAVLDNLIRDTWLLTRFARIDSEIIDYVIENALYPKEVNMAGKAFMDTSDDQIRLQRRINATRKSQLQAFKDLQRLQTERRAQPPTPQPHPPAQPLDVTGIPSTPQEQIGFVPQLPPDAPETAPTGIRHPASDIRSSRIRHPFPSRPPMGFVA